MGGWIEKPWIHCLAPATFSEKGRMVQTAFQRLKPRLQSYSSLVNRLLNFYGLEGIPMPYTMEDFKREVAQDVLKELTPKQRLEGLSAEEIESYLKELKAAQDKTSPDLPKPPSS
jgi:hypothetical protein